MIKQRQSNDQEEELNQLKTDNIMLINEYEDRIDAKLKEIKKLNFLLNHEREKKINSIEIAALKQEIEYLKAVRENVEHELKIKDSVINGL